MDHSTINRWVIHYLPLLEKEGHALDFMLSKKRGETAAKAFFVKAISSRRLLEKVTLDKRGVTKRV